MLLVDRSGILVSDAGLAELHAFAARVGCEEFKAGETPHYDLGSPRAVERAVRAGARLVSSREVRQRMYASRLWFFHDSKEKTESC